MKKKIFLSIFGVLGLCAFLLYQQYKQTESKIFLPNPAVPALASSNSIEEHFKDQTPFNILLLGYAGGTHDGPNLTDSMMIAHINPKDMVINLISIPRDIWVKIPTSKDGEGSYWKINSAYAIGLDDQDYPNKEDQYTGRAGGGNLAKTVIETVTGMPMEKFVALNFDGFRTTIDTLGGVDVNVEKTFDDYEYPITGQEDNVCGHPASDLPMLEAEATQSAASVVFPCRYKHLHFDKGLTHMDGETALEYVRSRHSLQDGTDFGRAARQRNLIVAVKDKIFSIGFIPKILPFLTSIQNDVTTDLTPDEAKTLISDAGVLKKYQIKDVALTNQNVLVDAYSNDKQAILLPKNGVDQWEPIHNWIEAQLDNSQLITSPIIKIENASDVSGLGALAYNRLQDLGFNPLPATTANKTNLPTTTITLFSKKIDPQALDKLKTEFHVSSFTNAATSNQTYDILISIGKDYNELQGKKLIN